MNALAERFPTRAQAWRLRDAVLQFDKTPLLMGVVNVTPDSFSDGGRYFDPQAAVRHGLQLAADGAAILDIGGESTRPYSDAVSVEEELRRTVAVVESLAAQTSVPISIDTSKATVAAAALEAGAQIVNDVTALTGDADMPRVVAESGAGVCQMHMQGTPQTMQADPKYENVLEDVLKYLARRVEEVVAQGVARERICIDPGVGFGKTHQHNLELLANAGRFHDLGLPVLVGHSRKGFIGKVLGDKECDRTAGTVGVAAALAAAGVQIIRVHDVAQVRQALKLFVACGGADGEPDKIDD